jgi:hypothetical protein
MIESPDKLRVLVANETDERLDTISTLVERLGHEIVARSLKIKDLGPRPSADRPTPGQRSWVKVTNPGYWRRDQEIQALRRSLERPAVAA